MIKQFYLNHNPDDILYAIQHPEYYQLTSEDVCELTGFVFKAISKDQEATR